MEFILISWHFYNVFYFMLSFDAKTTYQKRRKDLLHVRAFTTISTKHEGTLHVRRPTLFRVAPANPVESESSGFLNRGLTFETSDKKFQQIGEETDAQKVKAIPSNFVSVSKPSKALERLMTKRKNSYEDALENMKKELSNAHEQCDNELRERGTRIKIAIDRIRKNVEECQDKIRKTDVIIKRMDMNELSTMSGKSLQSIWDSITAFITDEKKLIDVFHSDLREVERNRQLRVKGIMQKYYEIFHSIAYKSPFEIQDFMENMIQDYNATVLRNLRVYEDLHLHMSISADSQNQELQNWLEDVNDRRRDEICRENMKRLIRQKEVLEKPEGMFIYDHNGEMARFELTSKLELMEETINRWQSRSFISGEASINYYSKEFDEAVADLKNSISKLIESYESGLQKSFSKYENEVAKIKEDKDCILDNDVKLLDEAVSTIRNSYQTFAVKFEDLINHHIRELETTAEDFFRFLYDFHSLSNKQGSHLLNLQNTLARSVDGLSIKNQKSLDVLEKKLNNCIQQLRQGTHEEKMKQQLQEIFAALEMISEKHKAIYEDECKTIKDYVKMILDEVPGIVKQFEELMESYGGRNVPAIDTETTTDASEDHLSFVKPQMKLCRNLVLAILDCKSTLMDEIGGFLKDYPTFVEDSAEIWQKTILSKRTADLQNKLDFNLERREQMQANIYDLRLQEIQEHKEKLENYEAELNQTLSDTSDWLDEFLYEQKQLTHVCENDIAETNAQIAAAKNTTEMKRLQNEIEDIRKNYKNYSEQQVNIHKEHLRHIFNTLTTKNHEFLQDIQLFKDGGNFSNEEAKSYRKTLTAFGKTISKFQTTSQEKLNKVVKELDRPIERLLNTTFEKCNTNASTMKFYEDADKRMTKCAVILERQAHRLLEDDTNFVNAVVNHIEASENLSSTISDMKYLLVRVSEILEHLESRLDYLIIAFPIVNRTTSVEPVKEKRKSSVSNKKKKRKPSDKTIDYSSLLIGSEKRETDKNSFSIIAMNTMIKAIEDIEAEAKQFFTASSKHTESEWSYNEYMEQIVQQLNNYREQLEKLWRQEVQNVLTAAEAFEKNISYCISVSLTEFHDQYTNDRKTTMENKSELLDEAMRVWTTERDDMLNNFKIRKSQPETRESLNQLTKEVIEQEEQMQHSILETINELKRDLETLQSSYKILLLERVKPLTEILSRLEDNAAKKRLRDILGENNRNNLGTRAESLHLLDLEEKVNRRSVKYMQKLSQREVNLNMDILLDELVEKAKEVHNATIAEAEMNFKNFVQAGEEFKQLWKNNMDIVAEIYEIPL